MEFVTLTNDVAELSGVVTLTSADVTLDTDGRDCSFKIFFLGGIRRGVSATSVASQHRRENPHKIPIKSILFFPENIIFARFISYLPDLKIVCVRNQFKCGICKVVSQKKNQLDQVAPLKLESGPRDGETLLWRPYDVADSMTTLPLR